MLTIIILILLFWKKKGYYFSLIKDKTERPKLNIDGIYFFSSLTCTICFRLIIFSQTFIKLLQTRLISYSILLEMSFIFHQEICISSFVLYKIDFLMIFMKFVSFITSCIKLSDAFQMFSCFLNETISNCDNWYI